MAIGGLTSVQHDDTTGNEIGSLDAPLQPRPCQLRLGSSEARPLDTKIYERGTPMDRIPCRTTLGGGVICLDAWIAAARTSLGLSELVTGNLHPLELRRRCC